MPTATMPDGRKFEWDDLPPHVKESQIGQVVLALRDDIVTLNNSLAAMKTEREVNLAGYPPEGHGVPFPDLVKRELVRAREQHPEITSPHAAYGIIAEELEEFWAEIKSKVRNKSQMMQELVQVAAMCQRVAEDLKLNDFFRPG